MQQIENTDAIHSFYIHPESAEDLNILVKRVNGIPALYTFEWKTVKCNPPYQQTIQAEGSSLEEARINAKAKLVQIGLGYYDKVDLNLIKLENMVYQINRGTMSATNNS